MYTYFKNIEKSKPLVHCITNYVTARDCANAVIAIGGSPIMSDEPIEVADITTRSDALYINIGTLNKATVPAMLVACEMANKMCVPIILDPVGVGASGLRSEIATKIIKDFKPKIIRGNITEILSLAHEKRIGKGVDIDKMAINREKAPIEDTIKTFALRNRATVIATGETDIITNGDKLFTIEGGSAYAEKITGAGCMLSAVIAAFAGANKQSILKAVQAAVFAYNIASKKAEARMVKGTDGTGSYPVYLLDALSNLNEEDFANEEQ